MMRDELEHRIVKFSARCIKACIALPQQKIGANSLADQLFRSSTSIAANYAEATEAESRKDFIHRLKIAMKELSETRIWLSIISEVGYLPSEKLTNLIAESTEICKILSASVITARRNEQIKREKCENVKM